MLHLHLNNPWSALLQKAAEGDESLDDIRTARHCLAVELDGDSALVGGSCMDENPATHSGLLGQSALVRGFGATALKNTPFTANLIVA